MNLIKRIERFQVIKTTYNNPKNLIKRIESEFSAEIISCKLFILNLIKRIERVKNPG